VISQVQVALVICSLFICDFTYRRSGNGLFSGTYPLIYSHPWSFYMRIHYMWVYFWSPYLSHITRSTCTSNSATSHLTFPAFHKQREKVIKVVLFDKKCAKIVYTRKRGCAICCLGQRCPTVFLCLPQLWRMNKAIRHILYDIVKEHL